MLNYLYQQGAFMKKKILIILSIWLILSVTFGVCYKIFGPKNLKPASIQPINSGANAAKDPFKSIGLEIANISLKNTKQNTLPFIKKMEEFGASDIKVHKIKNRSKFHKTLPLVIIGGKKYANKTTCVIVSYQYKDKKYEVGDCK